MSLKNFIERSKKFYILAQKLKLVPKTLKNFIIRAFVLKKLWVPGYLIQKQAFKKKHKKDN